MNVIDKSSFHRELLAQGKRLGVTQAKICEVLGLKRQSWGKTMLPLSRYLLLNHLGISIGRILGVAVNVDEDNYECMTLELINAYLQVMMKDGFITTDLRLTSPRYVVERMKSLLKYKTDNDLAKLLGIDVRQINSTSRKNKHVSIETIHTFMDKFDDDPPPIEWLLTGKFHSTDQHGSDMVNIPQWDVALFVGHGRYPDDHALAIGHRTFSRSWISKKGLNPKNLVLTRIHGVSMEPTIRDKD